MIDRITRICKVCGKLKGGPVSHEKCSKILQKKMQKPERKPIKK